MALTQEIGFNLTPKQRKFADAYVANGGNRAEAALIAYDCSNRNSARVIAHRNLNNAKIQVYLQELVLTENIVDDGVQALRDGLKADKIITNKQGEIVGRWPDYANRIKAALSLFKIRLTITRGGVSPQEEQAYDYWRERYIQEIGHEPTSEELTQYREILDIEPEETQIRLYSTNKRLVDLRPSTFLDE